MDPSLEEAARVSGSGTRRTIGKVTLPILFPSIFSTLIFMFMIGLRSFETPAFIGLPGGIRVYMNEIVVNVEVVIPPNHGLASAQATIILGVMLVILFFYLRSTGQLTKYVSIAGRGYNPGVIDLGRWKYATLAFALGYMFLAILLPLALLLFISFVPFYTVTQDITRDLTLDNYLQVTADAALRSATINSTLIALSAGLITTFAGVVLAYLALRSQWRGRRIFEMIGTLPLGYPGLVFGLALLWTFLSILRPVFGTPVALVIAYMVVFLPIATRSISNTIIQLHPELEEASEVSGASWSTTFRRITLPILKPSLVNTYVIVMLQSYRELGTAVLLSGPGMYVIPVLILYYWRIGWLTSVAAATMIYSGLLAVILLVVRVLLRSGPRPR